MSWSLTGFPFALYWFCCYSLYHLFASQVYSQIKALPLCDVANLPWGYWWIYSQIKTLPFYIIFLKILLQTCFVQSSYWKLSYCWVYRNLSYLIFIFCQLHWLVSALIVYFDMSFFFLLPCALFSIKNHFILQSTYLTFIFVAEMNSGTCTRTIFTSGYSKVPCVSLFMVH